MSNIIRDEEYVEAVRVLAWGEEAGKWENPPEGRPEGVDPDEYVRAYYDRTSSTKPPKGPSKKDGPVTKLLRELLRENSKSPPMRLSK